MRLGSLFGNAAVLDPADARYVTGSEEDKKQARAEWYRARFITEVMRANLEEIPRADLQEHRHLGLEDTRTGEFYVARRDGLVDLAFVPAAVAYFTDLSGLPILLEKPSGPQNRAELEQLKADREARRNAPQPRRAWAEQAQR